MPTIHRSRTVAQARTTTRNAAPAKTNKVATASKASSPFLKLIDGAQNKLYVHVWTAKPEVIQRLIAAEQRGVDVKVLFAPGGRMTPAERAAQDALETAGIDVRVDTRHALPTEAVVVDDREYADPRSKQVQTDPKLVMAAAQRLAAAFAAGPVGKGKAPAPNTTHVFPMPESGATPILQAINRATNSIDLEVYQLSDSRVNDALAAAARRGVKVRVMLEPQVISGGNFSAEVKQLQAAGIDVQATPPRFDANRNVDHAKFMLIDQRELLFGTGNLVRSGLGGNQAPEANNRDFWTSDTRDESLSEAGQLFNADWARTPTASIDFKNLVVTPDNADARLLALIGAAKKRLYVYNQELRDPKVVQALIAAKQRGVDVQVLLGVQQVNGGAPKNQLAIDALTQAGVTAKYLTHNYLHGKAIVSDADVFLGSQNFSDGGLQQNREVGEVLDNSRIVSTVVRTFQKDMAAPGPQP